MEQKYKVKIYPSLIVLSEVGKEEDLDLTIVNDKLGVSQGITLNLLEVIIYKLKKRHLFGIEKPLVSYNPNEMNKSEYLETIKIALKFLGIDFEVVN